PFSTAMRSVSRPGARSGRPIDKSASDRATPAEPAGADARTKLVLAGSLVSNSDPQPPQASIATTSTALLISVSPLRSRAAHRESATDSRAGSATDRGTHVLQIASRAANAPARTSPVR